MNDDQWELWSKKGKYWNGHVAVVAYICIYIKWKQDFSSTSQWQKYFNKDDNNMACWIAHGPWRTPSWIIANSWIFAFWSVNVHSFILTFHNQLYLATFVQNIFASVSHSVVKVQQLVFSKNWKLWIYHFL